MKPYECDYTWEEVKEAANKILHRILAFIDCEDIIGDLYRDELPRALDAIAKHVFVYGDEMLMGQEKELQLVKDALFQANKVGYIGKKE